MVVTGSSDCTACAFLLNSYRPPMHFTAHKKTIICMKAVDTMCAYYFCTKIHTFYPSTTVTTALKPLCFWVVRALVRPCVPKFVNTYLINCLREFHQLYNFRELGNNDRMLKFWGQQVKGSKVIHDQIKYGQKGGGACASTAVSSFIQFFIEFWYRELSLISLNCLIVTVVITIITAILITTSVGTRPTFTI